MVYVCSVLTSLRTVVIKRTDFYLGQMLNYTSTRVTGKPGWSQANWSLWSLSFCVLHLAELPGISWSVDACSLWSNSETWSQSHEDPSSASLPPEVGRFYFLVLPYFFLPSIPPSPPEDMNISLTPFRGWAKGSIP